MRSTRFQIAQAILGYFREHPDAQDTLPGITEWWLPQQETGSQTAPVKQAIAELVQRGFVLRHKAKDSQIHYRINRRKS